MDLIAGDFSLWFILCCDFDSQLHFDLAFVKSSRGIPGVYIEGALGLYPWFILIGKGLEPFLL